jgi:predicted enzyme related to lactoylglutathione lyase
MGTELAKPALDAGIVTANADPLIAFYRGVIGAQPQQPLELPNIGTIHKLACGESVLRIMVPVEAPEPDDSASFSSRAGLRYLTLEVEDVHAAVAAVRAHGGSVVLEPFELRPGRFVSQVADPDGNMIELGRGSCEHGVRGRRGAFRSMARARSGTLPCRDLAVHRGRLRRAQMARALRSTSTAGAPSPPQVRSSRSASASVRSWRRGRSFVRRACRVGT